MKSLFENYKDNNNWINKLDLEKLYCEFKENGYVVINNLICEKKIIKIYQDSVNSMHSGEIDVSNWRHDLGSHQDPVINGVENTGQIMWPSDRIKGLDKGPLHYRGLQLAKSLLGNDLEFDFDMLIYITLGRIDPFQYPNAFCFGLVADVWDRRFNWSSSRL